GGEADQRSAGGLAGGLELGEQDGAGVGGLVRPLGDPALPAEGGGGLAEGAAQGGGEGGDRLGDGGEVAAGRPDRVTVLGHPGGEAQVGGRRHQPCPVAVEVWSASDCIPLAMASSSVATWPSRSARAPVRG